MCLYHIHYITHNVWRSNFVWIYSSVCSSSSAQPTSAVLFFVWFCEQIWPRSWKWPFVVEVIWWGCKAQITAVSSEVKEDNSTSILFTNLHVNVIFFWHLFILSLHLVASSREFSFLCYIRQATIDWCCSVICTFHYHGNGYPSIWLMFLLKLLGEVLVDKKVITLISIGIWLRTNLYG